jgi:hypothetical protein
MVSNSFYGKNLGNENRSKPPKSKFAAKYEMHNNTLHLNFVPT